ncbi:hypothetical protein O1O06_07630 [Grimontia hollisae]|uniref:hypothetical protein n=1 Tax=Grimontia hollisae TaxID=673 RepID=UPI0013037A75|nr:hypothetical protein [Grimontia hollisae]MDF2184635.1 hypothetical protein [Grimontia hollisae]
MKVTIQFDHIHIAENASYREIYRALSDAMRENWPAVVSIPAERQQLAQQRAASVAARDLIRTLAVRRTR